jgi:hypothetical protein
MLPLQNWGWTANSADFRLRGETALNPEPFALSLRYVTPGYFQALGIRLRAGRTFSASDGPGAPPVIVVNEALARRQFGSGNPVGLETNRGRIVGVVADVRQAHIAEPAAPEIYYPVAQNWSQLDDLGMTLVVRVDGEPERIVEPVRHAVRDINRNLAVFDVKSMDQVVKESMSTLLAYLYLMTAFAAVGLTLAVTGTYGLIAYAVAARRREWAIRAAVGADRRHVVWLVLQRGLRVVVAGIGGGLAGVVVAAPLLQALPVSLGVPGAGIVAAVAACLAIVAISACLAPALRASRLEPMMFLRQE